jgi:hypothetical protein
MSLGPTYYDINISTYMKTEPDLSVYFRIFKRKIIVFESYDKIKRSPDLEKAHQSKVMSAQLRRSTF